MRQPLACWLVLLPLLGCAQARGGFEGPGADAAWLPDAPGGDAADPADGAPGQPDAQPAFTALVINEFVVNHTSTDTSEFIELRGPPSTDYADHVVLAIEGEGAMIGTVDRVVALGATDAGGRFATPYSTNLLENDTSTLLLVQGYTGVGTVDLDTDNDGVFDQQPWTALIDAVAVRASDLGVTYAGDAVLLPTHDAVGLPVGGASRMPDGVDAGGIGDWVRNDYDGQGLPCCAAAVASSGEALNTPGAANAVAE